MKWFALIAALASAGCAATVAPPRSSEDILAEARAKEAVALKRPAWAAKTESAARGEKTCRITNVQGLSVVGTRTSGAKTTWRVDIGRGYPLPMTYVYIAIDGKRFSEREDRILPLNPELLAAFLADRPAAVSWSELDRPDVEKTITLTNFKAAYDDCLAFLSSAPS